jgi:signal transduction histidine kinase/HAMP domain-containing protein
MFTRLSGLRPRLLLLVLLAVVPATLIMIVAAYTWRERLRAEAQDDLLATVHLLADSQQQRLQGVRDVLVGVAHLPELIGADAACTRRLAELAASYPLYTGLTVFDLDGDTVCSTFEPTATPINVADRAYFQKAISTGDFAVGEFQIGRRLGQPILAFGYPLRNEAGEIVRVLSTGLTLGTLNQIVAESPLPAGAVISIIDRQGITLVRDPDAELWVGVSLPEAGVLEVMLQNGAGTIERLGVDGVERLYAYAPVETPGSGRVYINVGLPLDVVYRDANLLLPNTLAGIAGVTALTLLAAWLWSRLFILKPVDKLMAATQRVAAGDLSARVAPTRDAGELSRLGTAFDGMAASLQQRFEQAQAIHRLTAAVGRAALLEEVYDEALNSLRDALGAQRASILIADAQGVMRFVAWRGLSDTYRRAVDGHSPWPADALDPPPVLVSDAHTDLSLAPHRATFEAENIRALGFFPLTDRGRLLGKFMVYHDNPHAFEAAEVELARTLASHIAFAFQRASSHAALQEETQALETLNRIGKTLSAELNLEKLVQDVTDAATALAGAAYGAFFYNVSDRHGERYTLYGLSGVPRAAFQNFPMPRNTALFGSTFRGEPPIRLANVRESERFGQNPPHHGLPPGHLPVTSYLAVPVVARSGEVLGGLFFSHPAVGAFTERHERLIVAMAAQAAVAMDNARLYAEAQTAKALLEERVSERTAELQAANRDLGVEVAERTRAEALLQRSREELRALSAGLQAAREAERARMAREIHDELGQQLTGIKMDVARLPRLVEGPSRAGVQARTEAMLALIDLTIQTVRRLATELRPGILDDFGLVAAIEWQAHEFEKRSGIACGLSAGVERIELETDRATAVFRIFQETLTNVARHAEATRVDVTLDVRADCLELSVRDNGRGIPAEALNGRGSLGLLGMRERVHLLAGVLDIRGEDGQGTTVFVKVPL